MITKNFPVPYLFSRELKAGSFLNSSWRINKTHGTFYCSVMHFIESYVLFHLCYVSLDSKLLWAWTLSVNHLVILWLYKSLYFWPIMLLQYSLEIILKTTFLMLSLVFTLIWTEDVPWIFDSSYFFNKGNCFVKSNR